MQSIGRKRFWPVAMAAALALALSSQAGHAQSRSDHITQMFGLLPATAALPNAAIGEVYFFDVEAGIASMGLDALGLSSGALLSRSLPPSLGNGLSLDIDTSWPDLLGFAPLDVRHGVSGIRPPQIVNVIALAAGSDKSVGAALLANGYEARDHAVGTAWWRGEDYEIDIRNREPADPFGGNFGAASRIGMRGDLLFQARAWADFDSVTRVAGSGLAGVPPVRAILAALDAPEFEGMHLVRAALVTDPSVYYDPLRPLLGSEGADIDAIREALEMQDDARVPLWTTGLYADLARPGDSRGVFIMAYASRADAERAAALIADRWVTTQSTAVRMTYEAIFGGVPGFIISGDSPAALAMVLASEATPGEAPVVMNRSYQRLLQTYFTRDMPFLSPF